MSDIASKLTTIAENQQKVYNAGNEKGLSVARGIVQTTLTEYKDDIITHIYYYAFYQSLLHNIDAPAAKYIGNFAFYQSPYLETVNLPEAIQIGANAFSQCAMLGSKGTLSFPKLSRIEDRVFFACPKISAIAFPEASSIGGSAFANCTALKQIRISKRAASTTQSATIGSAAFMNCEALTALVIKHPAVVTLSNSNALSGTPIALGSGGRIYVPRSLVSAYKEATNWSTYAANIYAIEDYPSITGGWN